MTVRSVSLITLITMVSMGIAGCTEEPPAAKSTDQIAFNDPNAILIQGEVVNDEIVPMAGIAVTLDPGGQTATTAEDGTFKFALAQPGTVTLSILTSGFEPFEQEVRVPMDGVQNLRLLIRPTPEGTPYHETQIFNSYMMCNYPPGGGCIKANTITSNSYVPEDSPDFQYEVAYNGLKEVRFEAQWNNDSTIGRTSFTARNPGALFLGCNSSTEGFEDTQVYYSGPGGNASWQPSRFWIRAGTVNTEHGACHEYTGEQGFQVWQTVRPGSKTVPSVSLQYRAEIFLTFFYWALSEDRDFTVLDE